MGSNVGTFASRYVAVKVVDLCQNILTLVSLGFVPRMSCIFLSFAFFLFFYTITTTLLGSVSALPVVYYYYYYFLNLLVVN